MQVAKKAGCILSCDPNLRLPLWPSADAARIGIMSIWDQADVIKVQNFYNGLTFFELKLQWVFHKMHISEDEIEFLTGGDNPYDDIVVFNKLFHQNLKLLIVTEGPNGCRYYTKDFHGKVDGIKVKCVDTTGAGDAFVGGLLHNFAANTNLFKDEKKLRDALKFTHVCGAITVTERAALKKLRDALKQFAGLKGSSLPLPLVFGIVTSRLVLLPIIGILVVKGALYMGFVHADPLYIYVLLLHFALPPSMNIGTITQLFGASESECSVIMLWTYGHMV